jgi:TATA-box binding protein (TBP) (component of TFIID and TFIIIB)
MNIDIETKSEKTHHKHSSKHSSKHKKDKHSNKHKKDKHSKDERSNEKSKEKSKDKSNDKSNYKNNDKIAEPIIVKATNVSISTCTVLTNLNSKLNLGLLSRFISVHDQFSEELDNKSGGIYNLEFYGNCARGETLIDKIKDEFNNQATIKFKYWGFRNVNVKFFANGKLQMTGLKYEDEAKVIAELLINIINNINVPIKTNITSLKIVDKTYDFQLIYDKKTKNVFYYRQFYDRFLTPYDFDTDIIYRDGSNVIIGNGVCNNSVSNNNTIKYNTELNYKRKGYVEGIHNLYKDSIEEENKLFLKENKWSGDNYIKTIIQKIEDIKEYFANELENTLIKSNTLIEIKKNIDDLIKKYSDFKFPKLDKILTNINKNLYSNDEQTLNNIKNDIFKYNKEYKHVLEKKVNRLINIRTIDITICNAVKEYLIAMNSENNQSNKKTDDITSISNLMNKLDITCNTESINIYNNMIEMKIPLEKLELSTNIISEPHNYYVSGTETVLINSDLSINHNINLKKISKILKKEGLFNTYDPDEYPGVLTKYYYNPNNVIQGICNCPVHCSTREKHSICTKVTISVFRPGSIIITGARNLIHLMSAHDKILKVLKDNIDIIKGVDNEDDNKQVAILNNEFRKISKKARLFFIKKDQIIDYDKIKND